MAAKNRRTFELRLGKLGLFLFVGGISGMLFSMFLLGVLVGKQMEAYPERYSAGMAEMVYDRLLAFTSQRGKAAPSAETGAKNEPAGGEEGFGLTFHDTLTGKKGGATAAKNAVVPKETSPEGSTPPPASTVKPAAPVAPAVPATAAIGGAELAPAGAGDVKKGGPPPEKRGGPESGGKPPAAAVAGGTLREGAAPAEKGRFEVQVAAYQESRKAEKMMEKLTPLGFAPRVVVKELPARGTWFRVVVGGFENREKAREAADRIAEKIQGVKCVVRPSGP